MIQDGQLVKFVNGGDAARIQKVQIAVGRDATRAPRVRHDLRGMPVQVVTGEDPTRAPFIHPFEGLAPAAWFRPGVGITVTGSGVSQWDDQSGNARHLLQGTDAARPIDLPFSGTRYLYLPGVAGNYASTPDSVPASITGDIDIRVQAAANDWTPGAAMHVLSKDGGGGQISYNLIIETTGSISFRKSPDGTATHTGTSSVATGFTDGSANWVRATYANATGKVNFYTSSDGSAWSALGTEQTITSGAIFDSNAAVSIGARNNGTAGLFLGNVYRAIIKNGIDGTTVVDFNPADASDGASSFASSATGETWTVNTSGALPAQIVGRASALFNGTSHYLKCNAFTLTQPTCVLMVVKQVSWTNGDHIFDGNTVASNRAYQSNVTPQIYTSAGLTIGGNGGISVGYVGVLSCCFNGAASYIKTNLAPEVTGNAGTNNMLGFTLGARGDAAAGTFGHIQVYETVIFPIAPSTAQLDRLITGLMARHGVA